MSEVLILLMTYIIKYVFRKKTEDLNLSMSIIITGINESKKKNIYHVNVNVNLMVENVTQIKNGIKINVSLSEKPKNTLCVQKKLYLWSWYM